MNNITRCVHIFPRFSNNYVIEKLRKRYDELYGLIEPHITLVFPFVSALGTEQIYDDISKIIVNENPFSITVQGVTWAQNDKYFLFLDIIEGREAIIKLHYKLYQGILSKYKTKWTKEGIYKPHITIGRFEDKKQLNEAINDLNNFQCTFRTIVNHLYVEKIGEKEESIIEKVIKIG